MSTDRPTVLIIEDTTTNQASLKLPLTMAGFYPVFTNIGQQADQAITVASPDVILFDGVLTKHVNAEYFKKLRNDNKTLHVPIIVMIETALADFLAQESVTHLAADDYVAHPFSVLDLIAKINAALKRPVGARHNRITIRELSVDLQIPQIIVSGSTINLTPLSYELLRFFVTNPDQVHSRQQLAEKAWPGAKKTIGESTVNLHIRTLRKALRPYQYDGLIKTVHQVGFLLSTNFDQ